MFAVTLAVETRLRLYGLRSESNESFVWWFAGAEEIKGCVLDIHSVVVAEDWALTAGLHLRGLLGPKLSLQSQEQKRIFTLKLQQLQIFLSVQNINSEHSHSMHFLFHKTSCK